MWWAAAGMLPRKGSVSFRQLGRTGGVSRGGKAQGATGTSLTLPPAELGLGSERAIWKRTEMLNVECSRKAALGPHR